MNPTPVTSSAQVPLNAPNQFHQTDRGISLWTPPRSITSSVALRLLPCATRFVPLIKTELVILSLSGLLDAWVSRVGSASDDAPKTLQAKQSIMKINSSGILFMPHPLRMHRVVFPKKTENC